eukprot:5826360-Karenia_brevis.AAC.1
MLDSFELPHEVQLYVLDDVLKKARNVKVPATTLRQWLCKSLVFGKFSKDNFPVIFDEEVIEEENEEMAVELIFAELKQARGCLEESVAAGSSVNPSMKDKVQHYGYEVHYQEEQNKLVKEVLQDATLAEVVAKELLAMKQKLKFAERLLAMEQSCPASSRQTISSHGSTGMPASSPTLSDSLVLDTTALTEKPCTITPLSDVLHNKGLGKEVIVFILDSSSDPVNTSYGELVRALLVGDKVSVPFVYTGKECRKVCTVFKEHRHGLIWLKYVNRKLYTNKRTGKTEEQLVASKCFTMQPVTDPLSLLGAFLPEFSLHKSMKDKFDWDRVHIESIVHSTETFDPSPDGRSRMELTMMDTEGYLLHVTVWGPLCDLSLWQVNNQLQLWNVSVNYQYKKVVASDNSIVKFVKVVSCESITRFPKDVEWVEFERSARRLSRSGNRTAVGLPQIILNALLVSVMSAAAYICHLNDFYIFGAVSSTRSGAFGELPKVCNECTSTKLKMVKENPNWPNIDVVFWKLRSKDWAHNWVGNLAGIRNVLWMPKLSRAYETVTKSFGTFLGGESGWNSASVTPAKRCRQIREIWDSIQKPLP